MATGRLKIKRVYPTPGTWIFTIAELAFCRIVGLWREPRVHYVFETGGAVGFDTRVRFIRSEGSFMFDDDIPFNNNEVVFILYKDPLP